jgi:hypothetical protein
LGPIVATKYLDVFTIMNLDLIVTTVTLDYIVTMALDKIGSTMDLDTLLPSVQLLPVLFPWIPY